jgi:hypothetical protein
LREDGRVGCSPDGFIGDDGILEIKCPKPENHIGYLLDVEGIGYRCQVQGHALADGPEVGRYDFVSSRLAAGAGSRRARRSLHRRWTPPCASFMQCRSTN